MPQWQLKMLSFDYKTDRIQKLKDLTCQNQYFLNLIVQEYSNLFESNKLPDGRVVMTPERLQHKDIIKMRSTMKSFMREWSSLGAKERE